MAKRGFGKRGLVARGVEAMMPDGLERALDRGLDRALRIQRGAVTSYVERLRAQPGATPESVIRALERRYLTSVAAIGAASGGAAAVPGAGTAASLASGVAEVAAFVETTALFTLAVADVHGQRFDDPQARRALVLTIVLGDLGAAAIGARQGALLVGRALPFGIGAGIGAAGNAALARASIQAARRAFGPPPPAFGPRIVDA